MQELRLTNRRGERNPAATPAHFPSGQNPDPLRVTSTWVR